MKKYEFTGKTKSNLGKTLHQIRSVVAIPGIIKKDNIGGWIEKEESLSHFGNAWVSGDAQVSGDANICAFYRFGSVYRQTTAFIDSKIEIRINCGCFSGSLEQFRQQIISTYGEESRNGKLYLGMANMIELRLDSDR